MRTKRRRSPITAPVPRSEAAARTVRLALKRPGRGPTPVLCECGDREEDHYITELGSACKKCQTCLRFRRKGAVRKGTRRSVRSYGIKAQRLWAQAAGFHNREGHRADSVYFGPDGTVALVAEHKQKGRFPWGEVEAAMQQAKSYCQAGAFPCVGHTTKPGPGKSAQQYIVFRAEDWLRIVERLGCG